MIILMMMMARTEYMRWKYRNNKEDKISVDESGMTQFDPLLKWEVTIMMVIYQLTIIKNRCKIYDGFSIEKDHRAVWKMQQRGSLGETLLHILIFGNRSTFPSGNLKSLQTQSILMPLEPLPINATYVCSSALCFLLNQFLFLSHLLFFFTSFA